MATSEPIYDVAHLGHVELLTNKPEASLDFFTRVLPKLELAEPAIRRALERDAPWTDDVAEAELRAPLRQWAERFYGGLLARLQRLRTAAELDRLEIEERILAPVEQLANALDSLS